MINQYKKYIITYHDKNIPKEYNPMITFVVAKNKREAIKMCLYKALSIEEV